jgi:hypothetical protein
MAEQWGELTRIRGRDVEFRELREESPLEVITSQPDLSAIWLQPRRLWASFEALTKPRVVRCDCNLADGVIDSVSSQERTTVSPNTQQTKRKGYQV